MRREVYDLEIGYVPADPTPDELAAMDARRRQVRLAKSRDRYDRWLAGSGIPVRLQHATLTARPTPALQAAAAYLGDASAGYSDAGFARGEALVLAGPTGVGKSYAAAAAMMAVGDGHFLYFPALCAQLLRSEAQPGAMALAKRSDLLVFDDLGTEYLKEGGLLAAFLDEIVWHREGNALPTVITTNLTAQELAKRLGDRITDRLRGVWGRVIECPGESLR